MTRLELPSVTLCAVTSTNLAATVVAMKHCIEQVKFGSAMLLTDSDIKSVPQEINVKRISRLDSSSAYSYFILNELANRIKTDYCLIVQWDGFLLDSGRWRRDFLEYDYIGAPWPQFDDGHAIGNGGFSLRSRRLLETCLEGGFQASHPEDVSICRENREFLERRGIRFCEPALAKAFSIERGIPDTPPFGFHGIFNISTLLGPDALWETYALLDDPATAFVDYWGLLGDLARGPDALRRCWRLTQDLWRAKARAR